MSDTKDYYHLKMEMLEIENVFFSTKALNKAKKLTTKELVDYEGYPYRLSIEDNGYFGDGTYLTIYHSYIKDPVFGFRLGNLLDSPLLDTLKLIIKRHLITQASCEKERKERDANNEDN